MRSCQGDVPALSQRHQCLSDYALSPIRKSMCGAFSPSGPYLKLLQREKAESVGAGRPETKTAAAEQIRPGRMVFPGNLWPQGKKKEKEGRDRAASVIFKVLI